MLPYKYKKCREAPLSMQVLEARWRLFGHVLRRDRNIPANEAMHFYFSENNERSRGRQQTTLPATLNNDLKKTLDHKTGNNIAERPGYTTPHRRKPTKVDCPHRRDKTSCRSCKIL